MYTGRQGLGLAPAAAVGAVQGASGLLNWLTGHSSMFERMQAAIPDLAARALQGDAAAYIVLRAWSAPATEEAVWCALARQQASAYLINVPAGSASNACGAPPELKGAARTAWQQIDQRAPDVAARALAALNGGASVGTTISTAPPGGGILPPVLGVTVPATLGGVDTRLVLLASLGLGLVFFLPKRGH